MILLNPERLFILQNNIFFIFCLFYYAMCRIMNGIQRLHIIEGKFIMNQMKKYLVVVLAPLLLFTFSCKKEVHETVITIVGSVGDVKVLSGTVERVPRWGEILHKGDTIITGKQSIADLQYSDHGLIRITENSEVVMAVLFHSAEKDNAQISLSRGKIFSTLGKFKKGSSFEVTTSTAVAAVRGTSLRVIANGNTTRVDVLKGKVSIRPAGTSPAVNETITTENTSATLIKKSEGSNAPADIRISTAPLSNQDRVTINEEIKGLHTAKTTEGFSADVQEELEEVIDENVSRNIEVESSGYMVMDRSKDIRQKAKGSR
jgi:hypothetical protein